MTGKANRPAPVTVCGPGVVMISGRALLDLAIALENVITTAQRDRTPVPPGLREAWPAIRQEAVAVQMEIAAEHRLAAKPPDEAATMTVDEAAELLEVDARHVRRLARDRYGGRKWLGAWVLDRDLVVADVERRQRCPQTDVR